MSRYIKSAETLKARAGKQVKVNGEIFDVTVYTDTIAFDNEKNSFNVVNSPACIERFLCKNRVASAGYKFKHTSSSKFILNKECRVTLKPYVGNFDDHSSCHTVVGMIRLCKDHCGDRGYMLLTNDEHLRGDPAADLKGYDGSWWLGYNKEDMESDVESTEPLESECNAVTQSGTEEKEYSLLQFMGDEDSRKTVKGIIKEHKGISYLLSNDDTFDGGHPDATEGTDYKYGWWLCEGSDISKSGYAIREACAESKCAESDKTTTDPLVRIAMALEDIATYLSRMSK